MSTRTTAVTPTSWRTSSCKSMPHAHTALCVTQCFVCTSIELKPLARRFWENLRRQSKNRLIGRPLRCKNRLIVTVTNAIVMITAMHNHMGNIAEYLVNPMYVSHRQPLAHAYSTPSVCRSSGSPEAKSSREARHRTYRRRSRG